MTSAAVTLAFTTLAQARPDKRVTIAKVGKVTPDQARDVAKDLLASVVKGQDPSRDRAEERGAVTFAKLADAFLPHVEALKKANTHAQYAHMLNAYGEALMTVVPMPKRAKTANPAAKPYEPTARELASQAAYAKRRENRREGEMNYALSMVCGVRPKDQIEATLGVQIAAIHMATMNAAMCMGQAKTWELKESQERALNRLARTYVAQVEALKRYRSKGEQRVIVERVNVEKGAKPSSATSPMGAG